MASSLKGIRVLDLSRVLAGPFCTQILGDLGAEIIKIEKPGSGDDTRTWGPPFLQDKNEQDTSESAYYLSCNRNKKSVAVDIKNPEGQKLIFNLLQHCDILIENFKVNGLTKYNLGYEQVKKEHPHIIYTSITGFGQTGPMAQEPGYDLVAQAMSGMMAATGEPNGTPMKVGVALSDIMTGLNAAIGTLAALNHRHQTGLGQHVDVSLLDCSLASMTNIAQYYLTSGQLAKRQGNAHATIVPYQAFEAQDGHIIIAVGNNAQFERLCECLDKPDWAKDDRFTKNTARVQNREILIAMIEDIIKQKPITYWLEKLEKAGIPSGPVNTMDNVFASDQIQARDMKIQMQHPLADQKIDLVGSPIKMSETPAQYQLHPPVCGQHTYEILQNLLDLDDKTLQDLEDKKVIESSRLS